jgi:hypothetical protein
MEFIDDLDLKDEIQKVNEDFCFKNHSFKDKILDEKNRNIINEQKDFETNAKVLNKLYNKEVCLQNPCFQFFIKFKNMEKLKKYFFILILNYLKIIGNKEEINYYILLYYLNKNYFNDIEITHIDEIINNIVNVDEIVVENKNILNIIKYSHKILDINEIEDIKKIVNELICINTTKPKITNCFDNTNEYYKDLLNELFYKIKKLENIPHILFRNDIRNYWCSIIKLFSILIQPNHLENSIVKITFYFIVKLIDNDLDFLEKKDFLSNNLYAILDVIFKDKRLFLLYPEISYLLNDNQEIYNIFLCEKNEEHFYSIIENDIEKLNFKQFQNDDIYRNIKKFNFKNIFLSMTAEYVAEK